MISDILTIAPLAAQSPFIPVIAEAQFKVWGPLTGQPSRAEYEKFLHGASLSPALPRVLVAMRGGELAGSVNLLEREMTIRPDLSPWLSQLFVMPGARNRKVGAALVDAALCEAARLGHTRLYLFTSGTLPGYYASLGWRSLEKVAYLGKPRTIMLFDLAARRP